MPVDQKNRMITFRLTEDEYERCRELCYSRGIGSVSGMARAAIHLFMREPDQVAAQTLESRVADLEGRLQILTQEVRRLNQQEPERSALRISNRTV